MEFGQCIFCIFKMSVMNIGSVIVVLCMTKTPLPFLPHEKKTPPIMRLQSANAVFLRDSDLYSDYLTYYYYKRLVKLWSSHCGPSFYYYNIVIRLWEDCILFARGFCVYIFFRDLAAEPRIIKLKSSIDCFIVI